MMDCVGTAGVGAGDDAAVLVRGDVRAGEVTSAAFWLSAPFPDRLATTRLVANAVMATSAMPTAISFQGLFQPPSFMIRFLLCAGWSGGHRRKTAIRVPGESGTRQAHLRQKGVERRKEFSVSRHHDREDSADGQTCTTATF